jgi:hypothetical protein
MRDLNAMLDQLAYHPATPETAPKFDALRGVAAKAAAEAWDLIPDGPEKTLAMRDLQMFLMHANLAVALTAPIAPGGLVDRFRTED